MDWFRLVRAVIVLVVCILLGIVSIISMLGVLIKGMHLSFPLGGIAVLLSVLYYIYHGLGDDDEEAD